jgi:hypothetical protein
MGIDEQTWKPETQKKGFCSYLLRIFFAKHPVFTSVRLIFSEEGTNLVPGSYSDDNSVYALVFQFIQTNDYQRYRPTQLLFFSQEFNLISHISGFEIR